MSILRICRAASSASSRDLATLTLPVLPRPPVLTWGLTTVNAAARTDFGGRAGLPGVGDGTGEHGDTVLRIRHGLDTQRGPRGGTILRSREAPIDRQAHTDRYCTAALSLSAATACIATRPASDAHPRPTLPAGPTARRTVTGRYRSARNARSARPSARRRSAGHFDRRRRVRMRGGHPRRGPPGSLTAIRAHRAPVCVSPAPLVFTAVREANDDGRPARRRGRNTCAAVVTTTTAPDRASRR